mmetsp:Transcript_22346/g.26886  ORF Transcript_22346/g.26886 Transcript_22346/m.26886 type:complete len:373 (+) Transcript_22346:272-1390(+)
MYMLFTRLQGFVVILCALVTCWSTGMAFRHVLGSRTSILLGLMLVLLWLTTGHWLTVDILAACTFFVTVVALRVPNLKIGCLTLCSLFLYDIVWVFFSPYIFGENIMVHVAGRSARNPARHVAQAVGAPLVLELPIKLLFPVNLSCPNERRFRLLGLGDLAVPGLLIALTARFDSFLYHHTMSNDDQCANNIDNSIEFTKYNNNNSIEVRQRRRPTGAIDSTNHKGDKDSPLPSLRQPNLFRWQSPSYSTVAVIAYFFGLSAACFSAEHFEHAQPALLYLVPAILFTVITAVFLRGGRDHFNLLWLGFEEEEEEEDNNNNTHQDALLPTNLLSPDTSLSTSFTKKTNNSLPPSSNSSNVVLTSSSVDVIKIV